jgi:hypothetical protein
MRERPLAARFGRAVLGECYGGVRMAVLRAEQAVRGTSARAKFAKRFTDREGTVIRRGPFQGMRFFNRVPGPTTIAPMVIGSYEEELHSVIEAEIAQAPELVVDIGSAEGYYATGLARRLPGSRVIAFDIDPMARFMCRRLARRNKVAGRVEVHGECDVDFLAELPSGPLVVCDCEGAEKQLLDPSRARNLRNVTLLVEVHDFIDPSISGTLKERFKSSHTIDEVRTVARDPSRYPELEFYSADDAARAVSEDRGCEMSWLVMRPAPSVAP